MKNTFSRGTCAFLVNKDSDFAFAKPAQDSTFKEVALLKQSMIIIMKRIGIIGTGGIANGAHITQLLKLDNCKITAICDRPLVLHGGSGTPDDQMKNAIHHGITKINIYSDVLFALNQGLKNYLNTMTNPSTWPFLVYEDAIKMMKDVVREKLRTFGSSGRV